MQGADAEQAIKQRGKSKVEFGIARLICVRQKETLILRESLSVCAQQTWLRELSDTSVVVALRLFLCSASTWPLLG